MTIEAELPNLLYQGSYNYSINKNKRIIKHEVQSGGCLLGEGTAMGEFYKEGSNYTSVVSEAGVEYVMLILSFIIYLLLYYEKKFFKCIWHYSRSRLDTKSLLKVSWNLPHHSLLHVQWQTWSLNMSTDFRFGKKVGNRTIRKDSHHLCAREWGLSLVFLKQLPRWFECRQS